jgi:hypothetical protein
MSIDQRRTLADLLEMWLGIAGIETGMPPMMFEDDGSA